MINLRLVYVRARASRVYTANKTGLLPQRMALLEPAAAVAFNNMTAAASGLMAFTDVYRSVQYQIECIKGASPVKRKLYAPPSKSGHNFGMSIDVDIAETLENFSKSDHQDLVAASKSRDTLAKWMEQFGWRGIGSEAWHFDFRGDYALVTERILAVHGKGFALDNVELQVALNTLVNAGLTADGVLGSKTTAAVTRARDILCIDQGTGADAWFQRVLACATAKLEVVSS